MDWLLRWVHCSLKKYEPFTAPEGSLVLKKATNTALDKVERSEKVMDSPGVVAEPLGLLGSETLPVITLQLSWAVLEDF